MVTQVKKLLTLGIISQFPYPACILCSGLREGWDAVAIGEIRERTRDDYDLITWNELQNHQDINKIYIFKRTQSQSPKKTMYTKPSSNVPTRAQPHMAEKPEITLNP